jgi:protein-L-isoaspartate(D-aspartate) O-methyltransferase
MEGVVYRGPGSRRGRPMRGLISLFLAVLFLWTFYASLPEPVFSMGREPEEPDKSAEDEYARARTFMVTKDIKGRGITDKRVLEVMGSIPRHLFVRGRLRSKAYADHPLPIGGGQTISQPYVVALMTELLRLKPGDRALEIGTGSGYQAAVLAEITDEVYTIEIREGLALKARDRLKRLGYDRVKVKHADGYFGWEEHAPFDAIIVTAAANHIPPPLLKQLKEGGRLIVPLGSTTYYQTLTLVTKVKGEFEVNQISGVRFVPMMGEAQSIRPRK